MKIKIKGFIQKSPYGETFEFCQFVMTEYGYIMAGEVDTEIDFDVPTDFNSVAVVNLNKRLDKLNDEHAIKVKQIKGQIQELLCIENKPLGEA